MASVLSSDGRISSHLDNNRLKLPTHSYFIVLSHSMKSECKSAKTYFYDVITNELYSSIFFQTSACFYMSK